MEFWNIFFEIPPKVGAPPSYSIIIKCIHFCQIYRELTIFLNITILAIALSNIGVYQENPKNQAHDQNWRLSDILFNVLWTIKDIFLLSLFFSFQEIVKIIINPKCQYSEGL